MTARTEDQQGIRRQERLRYIRMKKARRPLPLPKNTGATRDRISSSDRAVKRVREKRSALSSGPSL